MSQKAREAAPAGGRQRVVRPGPGMLVLPVVILFALAGVGALLLAGAHGTSPPATAVRSGAPLAATDATAAFKALEHAGEPPADILDQLPVPATASVVGTEDHDRGNGVYDRAVKLRIDASYAAVVAFYQTEVGKRHWAVISAGPPRSGSGHQLLARRASRDGFYWEVAATVWTPPAPPVAAPSATGGAPGPATRFQLRVQEVEEEQ